MNKWLCYSLGFLAMFGCATMAVINDHGATRQDPFWWHATWVCWGLACFFICFPIFRPLRRTRKD